MRRHSNAVMFSINMNTCTGNMKGDVFVCLFAVHCGVSSRILLSNCTIFLGTNSGTFDILPTMYSKSVKWADIYELAF